MADDSPPTPPAPPKMPRPRTNPGVVRDRDELSPEARAERRGGVPEAMADGDITGEVMAISDAELGAQVTAEDISAARRRRLRIAREARPTIQRIGHLEEKVDEIIPQLAHIRGVLEVLPGHVRDAAAAAREAAAAANAVANAHQIATVTAQVEIGAQAATGEIQVHTAEKVETIEKRKTGREILLTGLKIVAGLASGAGIGELIHQLTGKS